MWYEHQTEYEEINKKKIKKVKKKHKMSLTYISTCITVHKDLKKEVKHAPFPSNNPECACICHSFIYDTHNVAV